MIFVQLAVLLICIFIGARMSGIGLGVMGMIGLLILMFGFGLQPADPPLEVMLIILSVVTAAAALQAAGGMDYLVNVAGKICGWWNHLFALVRWKRKSYQVDH